MNAVTDSLAEFSITIPYRPLSRGGLNSPLTPLRQRTEDGWWQSGDGDFQQGRDDLLRALYFLKKHSRHHHPIFVIIEQDVFPNEQFLSDYSNVTIVRSTYVHPRPDDCKDPEAYHRLAMAYKAGFAALPETGWVCHGYTADLVCTKDWDHYIVEAMRQHGECAYVPMFIEGHVNFKGVQATPELIWETWRKSVLCHALTIPQPADRNYLTENDLEAYATCARSARKGLIVEPCGKREYGFWNPMLIPNAIAKTTEMPNGFGFDIRFDDNLGKRGMKKVVVTDSYVLHPWYEFRWSTNGH